MCKTITAVYSIVCAADALTDMIIYCLAYTSTQRLPQRSGDLCRKNYCCGKLVCPAKGSVMGMEGISAREQNAATALSLVLRQGAGCGH